MEFFWLRMKYFVAITAIVVFTWFAALVSREEGKVTERQLSIAGEHLAIAGIGTGLLYYLSLPTLAIIGFIGTLGIAGIYRYQRGVTE